jgi:hypothetical protein
VILDLVGHQDLETTSRYLHIRERQGQAAIEKLERRHAVGSRAKRRGSQEHMEST